MNTDNHRFNKTRFTRVIKNILALSVSICIYLWLIFLTSCSTKPTDMRTLVPAEAFVYLETIDLAAALQPIVDSKPFTEVAKSKPDFSALKGVQLAVAITGFETSEEKLTDEHSVGRVQPHFVAVADTHAWNYQALGFAEKKLGSFVTEIYDSEPTLEKSDKNGGKYFTWKAKDGRKAYGLVIDSLIYFGNDETAIDKCLAVRRGETDSIAKAGKVAPSVPETLASGYIGPDGIAQISNIIGLKLASEIGEDSEVQSAIAGILPQLLRGSVTDLRWTEIRNEWGIEDDYEASLTPEVGRVLVEALNPDSHFQGTDFEEYVPKSATSITRYVLKDPQIAWRSILLTAQSRMDAVSGKFLAALSGELFAPYGVVNSELFLNSVADNRILTAKMGQDGEEVIVITKAKNLEQLKSSLAKDLSFAKPPEIVDEASVWRADDGSLAAAVINDIVILGDANAVIECLKAKKNGQNFLDRKRLKQFEIADVPTITIVNDVDPQAAIVEALSERKDNETPLRQTSFIATRFDRLGMHRKTVSDFGLIGSIIAQLAQD